jgi:hypothetical protein
VAWCLLIGVDEDKDLDGVRLCRSGSLWCASAAPRQIGHIGLFVTLRKVSGGVFLGWPARPFQCRPLRMDGLPREVFGHLMRNEQSQGHQTQTTGATIRCGIEKVRRGVAPTANASKAQTREESPSNREIGRTYRGHTSRYHARVPCPA